MIKASFFDAGLRFEPRRAISAPVVSVLVPLWRLAGGRAVAAIDAVLGQDFADIELIAVDDGSIDGLEEEIEERRRADDRVALLRYPRRSGLVAHRLNGAAARASGRFIGYQLEDERYAPGGLRPLGEAALRNPDAGVVRASASGGTGSASMIEGATLLHPVGLMDQVGMFDPHLSMRRNFMRDLLSRAAAELPIARIDDVVATGGGPERDADPILPAFAEARMTTDRRSELARANAADCDIIAEGFLGDRPERLLFHSRCVLPFMATHFSREELIRSEAAGGLLPQERLALSVGGSTSTRSATMEMAFHNFADVFPGAVQILPPDAAIEEGGRPAVDAIVNLRAIEPPWTERRKRAIALKIPRVYVLDDDLITLFKKEETDAGALQAVVDHLRDADYVVAYAKELRRVVLDYNPRVAILAMNMPARYLAGARAERPPGKTEYAIMARVIRTREFRTMGEEIEAFFAAHRDSAAVTVFADPRLEEKYRMLLPSLDMKIRPLLKYRAYREALVESAFDFVINPLRDHDFNRSKSPVKYFEATIAGAILITSDTTTYKPVKADRTGIKVGWTRGAWTEALERSLRMSAVERKAMVDAATRHVRDAFSTEYWYLRFRIVYEAARLHALLGARDMPDGAPVILSDHAPDPAAAASLEKVLAAYQFKLAAPPVDGLADPAGRVAFLAEQRIGLVHASSPQSPWVAAARAAGLPVVATLDGGAAGPELLGCDFVIAGSPEDAAAAWRAGARRVAQWRLPVRSRGSPGKALDVEGEGLRIVARGGASESAAAVAAALARLSGGSATMSVEIDCGESDRPMWTALLGRWGARLRPRFAAAGEEGALPFALIAIGDGPGAYQAALKALADAVPVVALGCANFAPLIRDGVNGRMMDEASPDAIAAALGALLAQSGDGRKAIRRAALATAHVYSDINVATVNLLRFYRAAIEGRRG